MAAVLCEQLMLQLEVDLSLYRAELSKGWEFVDMTRENCWTKLFMVAKNNDVLDSRL